MTTISSAKNVHLGVVSVADDELRPLLERYAPCDFSFSYRLGSHFSDLEKKSIQALLVFGGAVSEAMLSELPALQCIQLLSAGFDNVDLDAVRRRNLRVADNAGLNADAVADHTVMLMLMCLRNAIPAHHNVVEGHWQRPPLGMVELSQLCGKTVGIIGLGRIGSEVARRLLGFETKIIYHDVAVLDLPEALSAARKVTFDELIAESDVITLHVPLTELTREMIADRHLERMKQNTVLINTSRGQVLELSALERALRARRIRAAALDVFPSEPFHSNTLAALPNIVLTPHRAGSSAENWEARLRFAFENIQRFFASGVLKSELC